MGDPVALGRETVEALERRDLARLRALVPQRYWDWLESYLNDAGGWQSAESLVGSPREVSGARALGPNTARLVLRGPAGEAFVTATFDGHDQLKGFALKPEEYEGIGNIVINCPDERVAELRAFYDSLLGGDAQRRPRLHFDEGNDYVAPRWPDPAFPSQMHFDVAVDNPEPVLARIEPFGVVQLPPQGGSCPVYADPAGHPFCLCIHGE